MSGSQIRLATDPMAAAIVALRLLQSDPDVAIFLPLEALLNAEGEVFPAHHSFPALEPITTREWPAYFEHKGGELSLSTAGVCFIDPVLAHEALCAAGVQPIEAAPASATELEVPSFDPLVRPSQMLEVADGIPLELPVLFDPSGHDNTGHYDQVLPFAEGLVMVRERVALRPLFAAQEIVLGLRTA